jgi:hypothetical protein
LKVPLSEFKELEVDETEVEVEEIISVAKMPLLLRPKTGDEMAFKLIGCPECVEYS